MKTKSRNEIEDAVQNGEHDAEYSTYIMDNCGGDRMICNGDTLIQAIEDGYLFGHFVDYLIFGEFSKSPKRHDILFDQFCEKMSNSGYDDEQQ